MVGSRTRVVWPKATAPRRDTVTPCSLGNRLETELQSVRDRSESRHRIRDQVLGVHETGNTAAGSARSHIRRAIDQFQIGFTEFHHCFGSLGAAGKTCPSVVDQLFLLHRYHLSRKGESVVAGDLPLADID